MSRDEKLAMKILEKNRKIHKNSIHQFNGEYIKEIGDGTLAIFQSSLDAVGCAIKIIKSCQKDASFFVRIGIHIGDIVVREGDVFGDGVNIASRIEAAGKTGGIYISERVYEDIKNKQAIKVEFIEERSLKNIDQPVRIYSVDTNSTILPGKPDVINEIVNPDHRTHMSRKRSAIPRRIALIILLALILVSGMAVIYFYSYRKTGYADNRIAVAIFENRTGDPTLDILGKMAADWLVQGLSRSEEIEVVPSTTSMYIHAESSATGGTTDQGKYLQRLAGETKAGVLISGSYYLQQGMLQFRAEIKNTDDGKLIYAPAMITGPADEPLETIERLCNELIGGLVYHVNISEIKYLSKPPNKDAYAAHLTGLELFGYDYKSAIGYFIKAALLDTLFLPPKVYIAMAFANQGDYGRADSVYQILSKYRAKLTSAEIHILDFLSSHIQGNNTKCLRHLKLAEKAVPGSRTTRYLIGLYSLRLNNPKQTVEIYKNLNFQSKNYGETIISAWKTKVLCDALHLLKRYHQELEETGKGKTDCPDMVSFYTCEVRAYAAMGKIQEVRNVIGDCHTITMQDGTAGEVMTEAALEIRLHGRQELSQEFAEMAVNYYLSQPSGKDLRNDLAFAHYVAGQWHEAESIYEQLVAEKPESINYMGYLGVLALRSGETEKAMNIYHQLKDLSIPYLRGSHTLWLARMTALLGDKKQAVALLELSLSQGREFGPTLLQVIEFESLRGYAPFDELMRLKDTIHHHDIALKGQTCDCISCKSLEHLKTGWKIVTTLQMKIIDQ